MINQVLVALSSGSKSDQDLNTEVFKGFIPALENIVSSQAPQFLSRQFLVPNIKVFRDKSLEKSEVSGK